MLATRGAYQTAARTAGTENIASQFILESSERVCSAPCVWEMVGDATRGSNRQCKGRVPSTREPEFRVPAFAQETFLFLGDAVFGKRKTVFTSLSCFVLFCLVLLVCACSRVHASRPWHHFTNQHSTRNSTFCSASRRLIAISLLLSSYHHHGSRVWTTIGSRAADKAPDKAPDRRLQIRVTPHSQAGLAVQGGAHVQRGLPLFLISSIHRKPKSK